MLAVLTANRCLPSWEISTQHGAVWPSANGESPIGVRVASLETRKAETLPASAPSCALETKSCRGFVGRNALPNGPTRWAAKGEPGAAMSRPKGPTRKLSMNYGPALGPTRVAISALPSPLSRIWPGMASSGSATVEPGMCHRWPAKKRNPL